MPETNYFSVKLTGVLTTCTPLHTSSGTPSTLPDRIDRVEVDVLPVDCNGRPYIPGSTLKGVLRAWLNTRISDENKFLVARAEQLFGSETQVKSSFGGKAEFQTARLQSPCNDDAHNLIPFWDADRVSGIAASVAIERRTRTADHGKLYYQEYLPPKVRFEVTIFGDGLTHEELVLLVAALEGFNNTSKPVCLGARTHDGWGRCHWHLSKVAVTSDSDVVTWWNNRTQPEALSTSQWATRLNKDALLDEARQVLCAPEDPARITLKLTLAFEDAFIVQDPSRKKSSTESEETEEQRTRSEEPDATLLLESLETNDDGTRRGRPLLPTKSIRGVLRSQAERIANSMAPQGELATLIEAIFGDTSARTAFDVTDFKMPNNSTVRLERLEFVGIDRFTGGAATGVKFDCEVAVAPVLSGEITLRLDRLQRRAIREGRAPDKVLPAAVGIMALLLRDVIEGDVCFGFGASKGFGACRGAISEVGVHSLDDALLAQLGQSPNADTKALQAAIDGQNVPVLDNWLDACLIKLRSIAATTRQELTS